MYQHTDKSVPQEESNLHPGLRRAFLRRCELPWDSTSRFRSEVLLVMSQARFLCAKVLVDDLHRRQDYMRGAL